jgi:heavy metal sensor kinase
MFSSVRRQLVAWQALLLLIVVAGLGTTFYLRVRHALLDGADADLLGVAQSLATQWSASQSVANLEIPETYRHRFGPGPKEAPYFAVWDSNNKLLDASTTAPAELRPEAKPPEKKGPHPYHARDRGEHREVLLLSDVGGQVLVGRNLHRERDQLRRLLTWIIGSSAALLAVGLAGAWYLAKRITDPIERMTTTAERISAANFSERLDVPPGRSEPARLAEVINRMLARLQEAFDRQTRFAADASHELRTPVSVVMSQAESALAKERSPEAYRDALGACLRAASRMKTLVDELLTLARSDAGMPLVRRETVDLRTIVERELEAARSGVAEQNLALTVDLHSVDVVGDGDRLGQVVANLLANAVAYRRDGGGITVALESQENEAVLTVADTGIGIAAEHLPHLFERFYRVDPSRSAHGVGSGLGLAICDEIVRAHGGRIAVRSKPGDGSTFVVHLPAVVRTPVAEQLDSVSTGQINRVVER